MIFLNFIESYRGYDGTAMDDGREMPSRTGRQNLISKIQQSKWQIKINFYLFAS